MKLSSTILALFSLCTLGFAGKESTNVFSGNVCKNDQLFQRKYKPQIAEIAPDLQRIIDYVLSPEQAGRTYNKLADFVDHFGARLTGSENLENSIDHMLNVLRKEGHDNVRGEPVNIKKWTRGQEWAQMIKPRNKKLNILGLGFSSGTNGEVIEAPIVVVRTFEELDKKSSSVRNKIVVYNFKFESYGRQAKYRSEGAMHAAKYGAKAVMVRSLTSFSIDSPHTGTQANESSIPAMSITVEDAELFQRLTDRNEEVIVRLYSENENHRGHYKSRNTVSEIIGEKYPDEVVLVSGHLDSWDVGQGAMDDGAGAFISWRALSIIKQLNLKPKRTIRSILWTGEEQGLLGAFQYAKEHKNELKNLVVAMESDIGTFAPLGLSYSGKNSTSQCALWEMLKLMKPINATRLQLTESPGSDIIVFKEYQVPLASLDNKNEKYFYFHHTNGDTMTVEDSSELDRCQAIWTAMAYGLATIEDRLTY